MTKIMFVCHGNICRSPMAEFIFKKMIEEKGVSHLFSVESTATSSEEIGWNGIGNPVYPPAREELKKHGIECKGKRARQITKGEYGDHDLFVAMDSANVRNLHRIFGNDVDNKIHKLLDYTSRGGDVADPWYSDRFDIAYRDIYEGCECLLKELLK